MVYKTKDSIEVYVIDGVSHSHRDDLNEETLKMVEIGDRGFVRDVISLGRTIGFDHLVETKDGDEIARMSKNGNEYETRFVMNKEAEPTDKATVIIAKGGPEDGDLEGKYILVTLFERPSSSSFLRPKIHASLLRPRMYPCPSILRPRTATFRR